jgi:hypothetical protein
MTPHRMHLHGPWQYEWLSAEPFDFVVPRTGRVTMPCLWKSLFGEVAGKARFRRRFHKPTNLDQHEQVYIVLENIRGRVQISINDSVLGTADNPPTTLNYEITDSLKPFNELSVEIEFDPASTSLNIDSKPATLWEWVAIEIRTQTDDSSSNRTLQS